MKEDYYTSTATEWYAPEDYYTNSSDGQNYEYEYEN